MIHRQWFCLIAGALLLANSGCGNRSNGSPKPEQYLRMVGKSAIDGKDLHQLLADYDENLTHLAKRIQASAEDRWYLPAHKYNTDVQINFDLQAVQADMATIAQIEFAASSNSAALQDLRLGLQNDIQSLSAAVRAYLAPNTPEAHTASLKAVRQRLEINRKEFLAFKKLLQAPATSAAKI